MRSLVAFVAIVALPVCAKAQYWQIHTLTNLYRGADGCHAGTDVDGDSFPDLVCAWEKGQQITASSGRYPWNQFGVAVVAVDQESSPRNYEDAYAADLDEDGIVDYAGAGEGDNGALQVFLSTRTSSQSASNSGSLNWNTVHGCDLEGDGRPDLLAAGDDRIWWWQARSTGSAGWTQRQIATPDRALWLHCDDISGDGLNDVVYANKLGTGGLFWAQNPDNIVPTADWTQTQIATGQIEIPCVHDMDGDGDDDFILPRGDGTLSWVERPAAPAVSSWPETTITVPWTSGGGGGAAGDLIVKGCAVANLDNEAAANDLVISLWKLSTESDNERLWIYWDMSTWAAIDNTILKTDEPYPMDCEGDGDIDIVITDEGDEAGGAWGQGLVCLENPLL